MFLYNHGRRSGRTRWIATIAIPLLAILLLCERSHAGPDPLPPKAIRARLLHATGYKALANHADGLELKAQSRYYGDLSGTTTTWCGPAGAFLSKTEGPVGFAFGFDGTRGHALDFSGARYELSLEDLDIQKLIHWVRCGYWLDSDAPVVLSVDSGRSDPDHVLCTVRLPGSDFSAEVTVDRKTWLPTSVVRERPGERQEWTLGDYGSIDGFSYARRVTFIDETNNRFEDEVQAARWSDETGPDRFRELEQRPNDTRFDTHMPREVETVRLPTGHFLVHPRIDDQDVGWFILDTGADAMSVDKSVADKLGLPSFGHVRASGVGGTDMLRFRRGREFQLGPVTVDGFTYLELDLGPYSSYFKRDLGGIIGYDFFARVIFDMDFANASVTLHDASKPESLDRTWVDFVMSSRSPALPATFEGDRTGLFAIDTGASSAITFHSSMQVRLKPLYDRASAQGSSQGLGGSQPTLEGTLAWFAIGDQRFTNIDAAFSLATAGALTDPYTTGTLGGKLFANYRLTFDYTRHRFAMTRSEVAKHAAPR